MRFPLIRRYFLTGLLVLVPVLVTLSVLGVVVGFFSNTIIGQRIDGWAQRELFDGRQVPGFGLVATLAVVLLMGMVASTVMGERLVQAAEQLLMKLPVVNAIYPPAKQIIDFLLAPKGQGFNAVVLVEFPRKGVYAIGFMTSEAHESITPPAGRMSAGDSENADAPVTRYVSVFVPFAPAPMSGALMVVPEDEVTRIDITVEEALRYIMSAGVLAPGKDDEEELEKKSSAGILPAPGRG